VGTILDHVGRTPLVELRRLGAGLPVPLLAKCEHLNPGGSVKDRIALAIVDEAEAPDAKGVVRLRPGDTIVEATAGNTGVGLAIVAALRGYKLVCVLPEKMSLDKRAALAQLGAEVIVTRNAPPADPDNFQQVARRLAAERGWFLTDQFRNPANIAAHERGTGPELLEQAGGRIGAFVAGVGTGGTITGVGRFLKARLPGVRIVLADPVGSGLAGWVRERRLGPDAAYAVEGIGSSAVPEVFDASVVDEAEVVSDEESFAAARRLVREEGLLVGGSAGTAVAAALRVAARRPDGPVIALLPDAWDRYRSKPWMQAWAGGGG
jgi:cysteine synthase